MPTGIYKRIKPVWNKGLTKYNNSILMKVSEEAKGRRVSEEAKKKISDTLKENYIKNPDLKRKISEFHTGRNHSEETKRKMSISSKKSINSGRFKKGHPRPLKANSFGRREKHFNWKGGYSLKYEIEFNDKLKEKIRKMYHYRCQECFRHQDELKKKLAIHHINYNKKKNNLNNLIPLCNSCHSQTIYDRGDWIKYYQNKVVIQNG